MVSRNTNKRVHEAPGVTGVEQSVPDKRHETFETHVVIDGDLAPGLLLICDHARNALPPEYGSLGIDEGEFERHIAYDIGAEAVTRGLAAALNVPAVMAGFSRLLIDPNRGEDDPTLIRQLYDGTIIPGNYPLDPAERNRRIDRFYNAYHGAIEDALARFEAAGIIPSVVAIHSMTHRWNGIDRPWAVSVLWDSDSRFAGPLLDAFRAMEGLTVGDNEPYDGALKGDTLYRHCTTRGISHALIELRQDLVRDEASVREWVERLHPVIEKVNALPHNHVLLKHDSRTDRG